MSSLTPHVQAAAVRPVHAQSEHRGTEPGKASFAELLDVGVIEPRPEAATTRNHRDQPPQHSTAARDNTSAASADPDGGGEAATSNDLPQKPIPAKSDAAADSVGPALAIDAETLTTSDEKDAPKATDPAATLLEAVAVPLVQAQAPAVATAVSVATAPVPPQSAVGAATPAAAQLSAVDAIAAATNTAGKGSVIAAAAVAAPANAKDKIGAAENKLGGVDSNTTLAPSADAAVAAATPELTPRNSAASAPRPSAEPVATTTNATEFEKLLGGNEAKDTGANKVTANPADTVQSSDALAAARAGTSTQAVTATTAAATLNASPTSQALTPTGTQTVIVPAAIPIAGIAVEIATQSKDGKNRFEIRLDPPELGRIDVRLDVDRQGNVTSRLVVERADTLDLLRRDSAGLERALSDAGLKTGDNALQFSLRDQSFTGDNRREAPLPNASRVMVPSSETDGGEAANYRLANRGGIDIRV